jgi:hypothetical protein
MTASRDSSFDAIEKTKAAGDRIPRGVIAEIRKEDRERAITAAQEDLCQMLHEVGIVLALIHLKIEDAEMSGPNSETGSYDNQKRVGGVGLRHIGFL